MFSDPLSVMNIYMPWRLGAGGAIATAGQSVAIQTGREAEKGLRLSPLNPSAVAFRLIMPSETGYMFMAERGFQMVS